MLASLAQLAVAVGVVALAPVPDKVVLETKSFGTVTLDHAAHLRERATCKTCHGPGPIKKIEGWTPRQAHDICVACHKDLKRGPTGCRQCHVVKPAPQPPILLEGEAPKGAAAAPAGAQGAAIAATSEALSASRSPDAAGRAAPPPGVGVASGAAPMAFGAPGASPGSPAPAPGALGPAPPEAAPRAGTFDRIAQIGLSLTGSSGSDGGGPCFRFSARDERFVLEESVDWVGWRRGRIFALAGGGMLFPFRNPRWAATALVVGGVDAILPFGTARPALGLRGGIEWHTGMRGLDVVGFSVTGLADLTSAGDTPTQQVGQGSLSASMMVGFGFPAPP